MRKRRHPYSSQKESSIRLEVAAMQKLVVVNSTAKANTSGGHTQSLVPYHKSACAKTDGMWVGTIPEGLCLSSPG